MGNKRRSCVSYLFKVHVSNDRSKTTIDSDLEIIIISCCEGLQNHRVQHRDGQENIQQSLLRCPVSGNPQPQGALHCRTISMKRIQQPLGEWLSNGTIRTFPMVYEHAFVWPSKENISTYQSHWHTFKMAIHWCPFPSTPKNFLISNSSSQSKCGVPLHSQAEEV